MALAVVVLGAGLLSSRSANAAAKTTIALTVTCGVGVDAANRKLSESLVTLLELQVLENDSLSIVERQQIDVVLQELALSRSRSADESLQLGKLVSADLLVMLELRPPDQRIDKPSVLLRVVEAKTAAICGVSVASDLDETTLEDVAEQFARYVKMVVHRPQQPTTTVAVAPFESVGRFDRLRPLELGIRDLVTARLLAFSARRAEGRQTSDISENVDDIRGLTPTGSLVRSRFQILQRSNLEHLLRELDLGQSGFVDKNRLPPTLSNREAAFLIKGEIDERQSDGKFTVVVRGALHHAATAKVRGTFEFECPPTELESCLNREVDRFAALLIGKSEPGDVSLQIKLPPDRELVPPDSLKKQTEADSLKQLALRDLHRFRRQCPIDFSHRVFSLPGERWTRDVPRLVRAETPLGLALLRKSMDRLETTLFIHPDDAEAAYAFGFCCSIHQPEIYRPDRADEWLRKAATANPDSELAAYALTILSELAFDDRDGGFDPLPRGVTRSRDAMNAASQLAVERLWFALEKTPAAFRDSRWPRLLELFVRLNPSAEQTAEFLTKAMPYAEQADPKHRPILAGEVRQLAQRLAAQSKTQPALRGRAIEAMRRWAEGPHADLASVGRQSLATIHELNGEFLEAAKQHEAIAASLTNAASEQDRHLRQMQWIAAAKCYRLAKDPERALQLLRSFEPQTTLVSLLVGDHGYEMAACYEALGESKQALAAYLNAAERCPLIVSNSNLVERVNALGGVPLREDREINVTSIRGDGRPTQVRCLATDGRRLFAGGSGVFAFDVDQQTWLPLKSDLPNVLCLKWRDGQLWVGTNANGLWRCDLATGRWTSFGTEQGLPDLRVESLAFRDNEVFAGVGTLASGGLVRIDERGAIHLFNDPQAPNVVPTHLVATDEALWVRTLTTIHEYSWATKSWRLLPPEKQRATSMAARLFAGSNGVWGANYGRELFRWGADDATNERFQSAWYYVPGTKAGYLVNFVAERGDDIWFGGQPWDTFVSSGLYRINAKTGVFTKFTPADGFASIRDHSISDGLWLRNRLWLATSNGLSVVTLRDGSFDSRAHGERDRKDTPCKN